MIVLIDNYDSFSYNLYQLVGSIQPELKVIRNDACTVEELRAKGITPVYLLTDHTGFYERYGWEFLCMVQGDGEPRMSRMYVHL